MGIAQTDVVIIGAVVVDRLNDVGGDASKSNSAIIHTGFDAPPGSLESAMVVHANPMYDDLCRDLDIPFQRVGAILVAVTEEEEAELPHILAKSRANHVYDVVPLTASQVRELEPAVTPHVRAGLYVPRESIIDPFILATAQAENAAANGATFMTSCEVVLCMRRDYLPIGSVDFLVFRISAFILDVDNSTFSIVQHLWE